MSLSKQIPKADPARRNKHTELVLERRQDGALIGPDLPKGRAWCTEAKEWWDDLRRSEIAARLEMSDWHALKRIAVLMNEYFIGAVPPATLSSLHAEIRRGLAAYGATLEDRLKLRMKFVDPEKKDSGPQKPTVNYTDLVGE